MYQTSKLVKTLTSTRKELKYSLCTRQGGSETVVIAESFSPFIDNDGRLTTTVEYKGYRLKPGTLVDMDTHRRSQELRHLLQNPTPILP